MATPLDVGLLYYLLPVFIFLFIFILVYAVLEKSKLVGDNKALNFIAALCIATLSMFIGHVSDLIKFIVPWFIFMFIFLGLLFAGLMFFGIKEGEIWDQLGIWTIIALSLFILLIGLSQTFSTMLSPYAINQTERTIGSETIRTIFHPRTLGAIFLLLVAVFTIRFIGTRVGKPAK